MFYIFSYTPSASDTAASPHEIELDLTAGVIHQVDVLFQSGCSHKVFLQIFDGNLQVWPSNRGEKMRGDATIISFREFYNLSPGHNRLTAKIWTTLTTTFYEIILQIGILPKAALQPLSFDELLAAVKGIEKK
jgi:hypothetical protein